MRILIADDEYLARSSLKSMVQEINLPIDFIAEATNGEEMATMVSQYAPDVAFVDIRMPKLNGLAAIQLAKEASPQTKWIILTAFPEFDYAKEAIRLGASSYLLKPVDPEELRRVLADFITENKKERAAANKLFEGELMALCYGLISLEQAEHDGIIAGSHFAAGILTLDSYQPEQDKAGQQLDFCQSVRACIEQHLDIYNRFALFVLPNGALVTIGAWGSTRDYQGEQHVRSYLRAVEQEACRRDKEDLAITLLVTERCASYSELQDRLERLQELASLRAICGIGKRLDSALLQQQAGKPGRLELGNQILDLCQYYHDKSYLNYVRGLQHFETQLSVLGEDAVSLKAIADFFNQSIHAGIHTGQGSHDWIKALQAHGETLLNEAPVSEIRGNDLIAQVTAFVNDNYMLNIGIGQIAEQLKITPNYLSALFHKKTGTNFMSYLRTTRMLKAKELLADPHIQVQQVAERVGYISARHFARLFAAQFGCLPSEYQENSRTRMA